MDTTAQLQDFSDACIRCGLCAQTDCGNYSEQTCLGDICDSLLSGSDEFAHFPFTCALCNRCTADCPVDLRAIDCLKPARAILLEQRPDLRPTYRHFRTDLKHNMFSLLQSLDGDEPGDVELVSGELTGGDADEAAFFPGCSLNSYSPELTERAFNWLREQGIASRKLNFCCGATFFDTGFFEEFESFKQGAVAYLQSLGIKKLIIVCPHCGYELPQLLEGTGIELLLLPELMAQAGVRVPGSGSYSMHDACYDRYDGRYAAAVKTLFEGWELKPLEHNGRHTICCGGGGMVSAYAPAYCEYRRNQRLAEVDAVDSDVMVSTCFSCVNSLQRGEASKPVRHYLELAFGYQTDWAEVYGRVNYMYSLPETQELLASDEPLF